MGDRTPELMVLAIAVVLALGAALLGTHDSGAGPPARPVVAAARIAKIERRVERLRGLRFLHPVPVAVVSPAVARRQGLADFERSFRPGRQAALEEAFKLLGFLGPRDDLRQITSAIYGEQVAGYYDPRRGRLTLVQGAGVDDLTLAHELTHALEDQHFDLEHVGDDPDEDVSSAQQALAEGTATAVQVLYLRRYPGSLDTGQMLSALGSPTTPLPPYMMRSLLFPYERGLGFVMALRRRGGWRLVNEALRSRRPVSTAQVIAPRRWLRRVRPVRVRLGVDAVLGASWRRIEGSTLGQADMQELLREPAGAEAAAVLGPAWRGGRFELWRRGPLPAAGCFVPCRALDVLVLELRTGNPEAARAIAATLGAWLRGPLRARAVGPAGGWQLPGGSAAVLRAEGRRVRVAFAPSAALARQLS
ncbi:MAG TPA: hypothetical protein VE972_04945 [Conexibacter sp.]|nr:hypothetical protein [Conexibacter sp.]